MLRPARRVPGLLVRMALLSAAAAAPRAQLEPEFAQRLGPAEQATEAQLLELARWSRERGWEREALEALQQCVSRLPASAQAHALLHEEQVDGRWLPAVADPDAPDPARLDLSALEPQRRAALAAADDRVFTMAKSSFVFDFWTDLDRARVEQYVQVMNPFYTRLKSFFRVSRTEASAQVVLFSTRSDYLGFYERVTEKSGEHTNGFFTSTRSLSLLSFCDVPHDPEVFETAKHEGTHLLVSQSLSGAVAPRWLNEGLACYFAADAEERSGAYAASCFLTARHAVRSGTPPTLRELTEMDEGFGFREYALAWSWVAYLMQDPETAARLSKLFVELRGLAESQDTASWSAPEWERQGNDLFRRVVPLEAGAEQSWAGFVERTLAPATSEQRRQAASAALALVREPSALQPPLDARQRLELLREAEAWQRAAAADADPAQGVADGLLGIEAALTRSSLLEYDRDETASVLNEVDQKLDTLLGDAAMAGAAPSIARCMGRLLGPRTDPGTLDDLRARIASAEAALPSQPAGPDEDPLRELRLLRRRLDVLERLVDLSRRACAAALASDPLDRLAMLNLVQLTLQHRSDDLAALLPQLLFQTQLDPDDRHLAALAAVFASLGAPAYADALMLRAGAITQDRSELAPWADVVARHREPASSHPKGCPLCADQSWIRCGRCKGQGSFRAVCSICEGRRQITCVACHGAKQLSCGHCGGSGKLKWEQTGETTPCKVCSKGAVKCPLCRGAGEIDCPECAAKGRVLEPCGACLSVGWIPCPQGGASTDCRLCHGSRQMPCAACLGQGGQSIACEECGGLGARPCEHGCIAGRSVCADCSGTGRVYTVYVDSNTKAGSSKCDTCGGRGYEKCESCNGEGRRECAVKQRGQDCRECQGSGVSPCPLCGGR